MIDSVLAAGTKSGYSFIYAASAAVNGVTSNYTINANPITPGTTGQNYYYTDATNVIRQNNSASATASDSPIGG